MERHKKHLGRLPLGEFMPSKHRTLVLALAVLLLLMIVPSPGAQAATLPTYFVDQLVVGGLNAPRSLAFLPSGDIIIVQNGGDFQLYSNGTRRQIHDMSAEVNTGSERGLLGVAVDPDYPARPYLYVHYTAVGPTTYVKIARWTVLNVSDSPTLDIDPASELVLIGDMPDNAFNHNGATVRFGPDKYLYISIGDDANGCYAQNLTILGGKILRIRVDDSINPADRSTLALPDNPFVSDPNFNARLVYAYGLRNPFRFDIDPTDGRLFIGDVGQNSWEEVDVSVGGENFGWPYYEGNHTGPTSSCPGLPSAIPWVRPIYEYPNPGGASVAMTTLYRGVNRPGDWSMPSEFDGNPLFFDFYSGNLRVLRYNSTNANWALVPGVSATNFATGMYGVTDMRIGPDGALYYISAGLNELRRIVYQTVPAITTSSVPGSSVGIEYSFALSAIGNSLPFNWSIVGGALPAGLGLNGTAGVLEGTPSGAGSFGFTVQVSSAANRTASKAFTIVVAAPLLVETMALPEGVEGSPYGADLVASGGTPPYTWSLNSGALPPGIALDGALGRIEGTPLAPGNTSFTLQVTDFESRVTPAALWLNILPRLAITISSVPSGQQGVPYDTNLTAAGGTPPYLWDLAAGSLPPGLLLDSPTGRLSGTPTASGAYAVTFRVTDNGTQVATRSIDVVIASPPGGPPVINLTALPDGIYGVNYSGSVGVVGGSSPYLWEITAGALPASLTLNGSTGAIAGRLTEAGNFSVTIRVTDAFGRNDSRVLNLSVIRIERAIRLSDAPLADAVIGEAYAPVDLIAVRENLTLPLIWSLGALPAGMTISPAGVLMGTPLAGGIYTVIVAVEDSSFDSAAAVRYYTLNVSRVTILSLPSYEWTQGAPVAVALGTVGPIRQYLWSVNASGLPPGVRLDAAGVLRGTPLTPGTYTLQVTVVDANNSLNAVSTTFTVSVVAAPTPPPPENGAAASVPWWLFVLLFVIVVGAAAAYLGWSRRRRAP